MKDRKNTDLARRAEIAHTQFFAAWFAPARRCYTECGAGRCLKQRPHAYPFSGGPQT